MTSFRIVVGIVWAVLVIVSAHAIQQLGVDGSNIFITDFAHPWRAQFNADFSAHLMLMASWIIYREPKLWVGIVCAVLSVLGGGVFSLAYIIVAAFRAGGNTRLLLLGRQASDNAIGDPPGSIRTM
jgi:hypothetical protein